MFVFNVPPTAKVIWRWGHGLKSQPTDWRSWESNLRPLVYKASGLSTIPQRLLALDSESQSCPSDPSFKRSISNRQVVPNYYFTGSRIEQIHHARLTTNCSCFNYTMFIKNIIQNKFCDCCEIEDTQHFLFHCARYTAQRQIMIEEVQRHCVGTLNILLFGDMNLNSYTKLHHHRGCSEVYYPL